jgi:tRNA threonylcarbamoyl adenosine modification protein YeaZ
VIVAVKNFLAVDTSGGYLSVVARKGETVFSSLTEDCAMKHSVLLMEKIDEAFNALSLTPAECDFFSAVVGAGSFTGIRIGISAIKGFCLAENKPALPVTSFDLMAYTRVDTDKILCLIDALHGFYYASGYENGEVVYPPNYISEEEVLRLKKEGYRLLSTEKLSFDTMVVDPKKGLENAVCALEKKNAFGELTALYIRKSSAEINAGR